MQSRVHDACVLLVYNNVVVCFDQAASASAVARRVLVHCRLVGGRNSNADLNSGLAHGGTAGGATENFPLAVVRAPT
jgi:hypothetical protein